ncbi:MAG: alpha/beta fold hydrolase [Vicingaceae bacterium]
MKYYLSLISVCLFYINLHSQREGNAKLIPRSDIFSDVSNHSLTLSPNGDFVVYKHFDGYQNKLLLYNSNDKEKFVIDSTDAFLKPSFSASSELMLLKKGENQSSLFIYNPYKEEFRVIPLNISYSSGGILALSDKNVLEVVAYFLIEEGYFLYRVNIGNGEVNQIEKVTFSKYVFDSDLNPVVASKSNENQGESFYKKQNGAWIPFHEQDWDEGKLMGSSLNGIVSRDSTGKIYAVTNKDHDKTQLVVFDLKSNSMTTLLENKLADIYKKEVILDEAGRPRAIGHYFGDLKWQIIDSSIIPDIQFLKNQMKGSFSVITVAIKKWLIKFLDGGPSQYFLYNSDEKTMEYLCSEAPQMNQYKLANRTNFTYQTSDGIEFPILVYLPRDLDSNIDGIPDVPLPTIVYVHGGPWVGFQSDSWYSNRNFQLLADRGYAVLIPEFRGAVGYGKGIVDSSNFNWGKKMHRDILEATDWGILHGIAKEGNIGIYGWSYGGYETMYALGANPEKYKCAISLFGISNLNSFLNSEMGQQPLWTNRVGNIMDDSVILSSTSPINLVPRYKSPILLSQGLKDKLVKNDQMDEMAKRLNQLEKDVIYMVFEKEGHDYQHKESHLSFWSVAEYFLSINLKGVAENVNDDLNLDNIKLWSMEHLNLSELP